LLIVDCGCRWDGNPGITNLAIPHQSNNQQSTINNQQCPPVRVPDGFFVAIFRIHGLGAAVHAIESGRVLSNDQYQLNP
jgi:hypothetical protein